MEYKDQMNRTIRLENFPRRIVSLVPSQTELLFDLGLEDEVVGITKFCIHPDTWFRSKTRVGGTKTVDINKVQTLEPDLIIANKEENTKEDIEKLVRVAPVWISDIHTLEEALDMIKQIGVLTNRGEKSRSMITTIREGFEAIQQAEKRKRVLYLIWERPVMAAGNTTFIHDMLTRIGWENVLEEQIRYPELSDEEIVRLQPDLIILSSEPYPYKEEHVQRYQKLCPGAEVRLLDGEFFSWYGSRLVKALPYFQKVISE